MSTKIVQRDRKWRFTIGDAKTLDAIVFDDYQMSFDVYKTSDNTRGNNSASVEIINIPRSVREKLQTDYPFAIFEIGYGNEANLKPLFQGQVVSLSTRKNGTDVVTQFTMGSGYTDLNHQTIAQHVPAGKTVKDVFDELIAKFPNISRGVYNGTNLNSQLINGYSLSGTLKSCLDSISNSYKLEWRLDGDVLYVNDKSRGDTENFNTAFVISPSSGLIEIPYYVSGDVRRSIKDDAKQQGVQFVMLPNPSVIAGSIIKLEDTEITGWFKVLSTRFSGTYRGGDWKQEIQCSAITKVDKQQKV